MATKTRAEQPKMTKQSNGLRTAKAARVGKPVRGRKGERVLRSKVTGRWQTTLPSGVRKALGLDAGGEIEYEIHGDKVVIHRVTHREEEVDPVVSAFLDFLERDMREHPEQLTPVTEGLVARLRSLTEGVEVGRDERIEGPVAL